jgi:hypothetical protein
MNTATRGTATINLQKRQCLIAFQLAYYHNLSRFSGLANYHIGHMLSHGYTVTYHPIFFTRFPKIRIPRSTPSFQD